MGPRKKRDACRNIRKISRCFLQKGLGIRVNTPKHTIDTQDARPIKQPPRRVPSALAEEERLAILQL